MIFPKPEIKDKIVNELIKNQEQHENDMFMLGLNYDLGEKTELTCTCGGILYTVDTSKRALALAKKIAGNPRYSKRTRLKKKFEKKHKEKLGAVLTATMFMETSFPNGFICEKCKRYRGFYNTIARSRKINQNS